jgi:hypothetical protein
MDISMSKISRLLACYIQTHTLLFLKIFICVRALCWNVEACPSVLLARGDCRFRTTLIEISPLLFGDQDILKYRQPCTGS